MDVDAATRTMIDNIPARTGRSLEEWFALLAAADLDGHARSSAWLKTEHGMSHGFANLVVTLFRRREEAPATSDDLVDAQYSGAKAALRGTPGTERLRETSGMCTHRVDVADADQVDDELLGWLREAYERAG